MLSIVSLQDTRSQNVDHLNALLQTTFHKLMDLTDQMESELDRFRQSSEDLKQTSKLYVHLVR